jgi:hypothetical protein
MLLHFFSPGLGLVSPVWSLPRLGRSRCPEPPVPSHERADKQSRHRLLADASSADQYQMIGDRGPCRANTGIATRQRYGRE